MWVMINDQQFNKSNCLREEQLTNAVGITRRNLLYKIFDIVTILHKINKNRRMFMDGVRIKFQGGCDVWMVTIDKISRWIVSSPTRN